MKKLTTMLLLAFGLGLGTAQTTKVAKNEVKKETQQQKTQKTQDTQAKATTTTTPKLKKDGTPDRRYKQNQKLKKDGTPDRRYKENKTSK